MHKFLLAAVAATTFVAMTTASFSMGGGYGPGVGTPGFDDYGIAVRLIKHDEFADAIPHLKAALVERPHSADILNYLGYASRMTGDYPGSLDYYTRALAIDPSHKEAHEYLGELYLQMHDLASAQHELDTLASLCPDGCDARDMLTKSIAAYVPPASN